MHVVAERLYEFVMGLKERTGAEQSLVGRCCFCVDGLDACVEEKIGRLYFFAISSLRRTPSTNLMDEGLRIVDIRYATPLPSSV